MEREIVIILGNKQALEFLARLKSRKEQIKQAIKSAPLPDAIQKKLNNTYNFTR